MRYAFLSFENLSGDSSLDWTGRGASEFLSTSLRDGLAVLNPDAIARAGQPLGAHLASAPGISSERTSAIIGGANRIVAGYVERASGGVRVTASDEDIATHQTLRTFSVTAPTPLAALNLLSRDFSPQARPPGTGNAEAFRLYSTALQVALPEARALLEQAVRLDPTLGRAWLLLARTDAALGDRDRAKDAIAQADAQKITLADRAWLDFESASLSADRASRISALRKVSALEPADTGLARTLAESETSAGNFAQAATVWKRLTMDNPADGNAWNQLGYTLGWGGDYAGALTALRQYAVIRPADPNPLDSQGDMHFWFGKYADAAASYSAAYAKTPAFLNGGDLYKAAFAKFMSGERAGADTLFAKFREAREKAKDPNIEGLTADWLYRSGRTKEATTLLRNSLKSESNNQTAAPPAIRAETAAQLAFWDLLAGDRAGAGKDLAAGGTTSLTPNDFMVRFAAMPTASAAEWEARAEKVFAPSQIAPLRNVALGYALILDGKKKDALPLWEKIVAQAPATDFFARAILTRLKGSPIEHFAPPDPSNFSLFTVLTDKL